MRFVILHTFLVDAELVSDEPTDTTLSRCLAGLRLSGR